MGLFGSIKKTIGGGVSSNPFVKVTNNTVGKTFKPIGVLGKKAGDRIQKQDDRINSLLDKTSASAENLIGLASNPMFLLAAGGIVLLIVLKK